MVKIGNDWDEVLHNAFQTPSYLQLREFLKREYAQKIIYPNMYDIFNALKLTAYQDVKVVILGQDPYHQPNQAHGLAFSVQDGVAPPPSLVNIYKEIFNEYGIDNLSRQSGNLTKWANQGVLLLNTVLTVEANKPNSHKGKGWEQITDSVISALNQREKPLVFLLWGGNAKAKLPLITNPNHLILTAPHPSPLSAYHGFFGCGHFQRCNQFLKQNQISEINWSV